MYFDDMQVGASAVTGSFEVTAEEIATFAQRWDPMPMHLNATAAQALGMETLSAPSALTFSIKQRLLHQFPFVPAVVAAAGYEAVRFPKPLYAGRRVRLHMEVQQARPSQSRPDRGVVTLRLRLVTDCEETVLDYLDIILVRRRSASA
jgi:acyl dehydratase